jgi:hypothetical protein
MVAASRVNNPGGVAVAPVVTLATQRRGLRRRGLFARLFLIGPASRMDRGRQAWSPPASPEVFLSASCDPRAEYRGGGNGGRNAARRPEARPLLRRVEDPLPHWGIGGTLRAPKNMASRSTLAGRCRSPKSARARGGTEMITEVLSTVLVLGAYVVMMRWILPRLGVPTWYGPSGRGSARRATRRLRKRGRRSLASRAQAGVMRRTRPADPAAFWH